MSFPASWFNLCKPGVTDYGEARARLVRQLRAEISDERVLAAISAVPRERFVSPELRAEAYEDKPLPIGYEQTISQPFIVALMTQALELKTGDRVLEVGTGSGYQAAVLGKLAERVVSVERIPQMAEAARRVFTELGYTNIIVYQAEDTLGWRSAAPYDAIVVTAAAPEVPCDLLAQLAIGGRLVIPVGLRHVQELCRITRYAETSTVEKLGGCRFVPLIGKGAWEN